MRGEKKAGLRSCAWIKVIPCLAMAILCLSCAGSPRGVQDAARERNWAFEGQDAGGTGVVFVPKGVYLVGMDSSRFGIGQWVRIIPGHDWPETGGRPTLIVGRISERRFHASRLEMLAYIPNVRGSRLEARTYDLRHGELPHAISKRLTYPVEFPVPEGSNEIHAPLSGYDLMEGNEIYGAFDFLDAPLSARLGNRIAGLLDVVDKGEQGDDVRMALRAGHIPERPALVLLGMRPEPYFDVEIESFGAKSQTLYDEMQHILSSGVPGADQIRLVSNRDPLTGAAALEKIGGSARDRLKVLLDGKSLYDQGLRVDGAPWRMVYSARAMAQIPDFAALSGVASALMLLGYPSSAAYLLESRWGSSPAAAKAALAPAMAYAYVRMMREDWAFEIGLELLGHADKLSGAERLELLAAAGVVFSMVSRSGEFDKIYREVYRGVDKLDPAWQTLTAHALLRAEFTGARAWYGKLSSRLARVGHWTAGDDMSACAYETLDLESDQWSAACERGSQHARTDFEKLWFESLLEMANGDEMSILAVSGQLDGMGAPYLASRAWRAMLEFAKNVQDVEMMTRASAMYADVSHQFGMYLSLMSGLGRFMSAQNAPIGGDVFSHAVRVWRSLDIRPSLAALCVARAQQLTGDEAADLLQFASELYLSIGDRENVALVDAMLAKRLQQQGMSDRAARVKERARQFGRGSLAREVKQALEQEE